jgi:2-(1,2-epoxy-1,2-dihydrophenyl)acetyl-CoA isomerase
MAAVFHTGVARLARLEKPVVCAVQGAAAGGGLSWMCASDLVLAADSAKFKVAYSAIGFTMDGGSTFFLPRLIGLRRAVELAFTNRTLSAKEALEIGLITEVVPELELHDRAAAQAAKLAAGPTWALGRIKKLLHDSWNTTLETQLEQETRSVSEASGRPDGREGVAAFVEKRRPTFTGE